MPRGILSFYKTDLASGQLRGINHKIRAARCALHESRLKVIADDDTVQKQQENELTRGGPLRRSRTTGRFDTFGRLPPTRFAR